MRGRSRRKKKVHKSGGTVLMLLLFLAFSAAVVVFGVRYLAETAPEKEIAASAGAGEKEEQPAGTEQENSPEAELKTEPEEIVLQQEESSAEESTQAEETEAAKYDTSDGSLEIVQNDPDTVTLTFAGDILFDERYAVMAALIQRCGRKNPDFSQAFDENLLALMRGSDIFMLNNEFPYSDRGEALPEKTFTFRADPEYAQLLNQIGTDIVSLANNHVNDFGTQAMLDTFDAVDAAGVSRVGAGHNIEEASAPVYFTNGSIKIGVLAATQIERMNNPDTVGAGENSPGVFRCLNTELLCRKIREAKQVCDYVIVYVHWGTEESTRTDSWQEKQAEEIAAAGADLIIGDHPHVLQRLGKAGNGVPVVFSLGNYLFNSKTLDTCLIRVTLDAETAECRSMQFIPAIQSGCRTHSAEGQEKERILSFMREISEGVTIDEDGYFSF